MSPAEAVPGALVPTPRIEEEKGGNAPDPAASGAPPSVAAAAAGDSVDDAARPLLASTSSVASLPTMRSKEGARSGWSLTDSRRRCL